MDGAVVTVARQHGRFCRASSLRATVRAATACAVLGIAACTDPLPADLGDSPLDRARVADEPLLAHLADAQGDEELTVEELFREFAPTTAPDPSAMLGAQAAPNPASPSAPELRVLSYNVGLLSRWYPFQRVEVPEVRARRESVPEDLLDDDWDILLLQEVWEWEDVDRFEEAAFSEGYRLYAGGAMHDRHGLLTLVRAGLIDNDGAEAQRFEAFELQRDIEDYPGPSVERGFTEWSFELVGGGPTVHLFNTHMTSFPAQHRQRNGQARQLGRAARAARAESAVIVGGDLNSAPYYPHDEFGRSDGEPVTGWWQNASAYPLMLYYGDLIDAVAAVGAASDVVAAEALPAYSSRYEQEPLAGHCDRSASLWTATDCNSLHFRQYAGEEYPARIDHVMIRRSGPLQVRNVERVYDEQVVETTTEPVERSDHYGVGVSLTIERPGPASQAQNGK